MLCSNVGLQRESQKHGGRVESGRSALKKKKVNSIAEEQIRVSLCMITEDMSIGNPGRSLFYSSS